MERTDAARVLVVDDEPSVLDMTLRALRAFGFEAEGAVSASLALARLQVGAPSVDAVLLDYSLPNATCADTVAAIRSVAGEIPVVVMSGHGTRAESVPGAAAFLAKPFQLVELAATVRAALRTAGRATAC